MEEQPRRSSRKRKATKKASATIPQVRPEENPPKKMKPIIAKGDFIHRKTNISETPQPTSWNCCMCTLINSADAVECTACGSAPPTKQLIKEEKKLKKAQEKAKKAEIAKARKLFNAQVTSGQKARIGRAINQRLYLVRREQVSPTHLRCVVLGSTGNVYNINLSESSSCNCPDSVRGTCKHIYFILIRVLKVSRHDPLLLRDSIPTGRLLQLFNAASPADTEVVASSEVQRAYKTMIGEDDDQDNEDDGVKGDDGEVDGKVKRKVIEDDEDCCICYELLKNAKEEKLVWCRACCGQNFHVDCFSMWCKSNAATCPLCRSEWKGDAGVPKKPTAKRVHRGRLQYNNLAHVSGQEARSSSYLDSSWWRHYRRY